MKKSDMTCQVCINAHASDSGIECRFLPTPVIKSSTDWCSRGKWAGYIARYNEVAIYFWGEWDEGDWKFHRILERVA